MTNIQGIGLYFLVALACACGDAATARPEAIDPAGGSVPVSPGTTAAEPEGGGGAVSTADASSAGAGPETATADGGSASGGKPNREQSTQDGGAGAADATAPQHAASSAVPDAGEEPAVPPIDAAVSDYPAGPYGAKNPGVGAVIENLQFRGLLNTDAQQATGDLMLGDYSLQSLRELGRTHLLLLTSAAWCSSCRIAAAELGVDFQTEVQQLTGGGGVIVQLLLEGLGSEPPNDGELRNWALAAELEASVLGPTGDGRTAAVFPEREWAYIIRLDTAQVVWSQKVALYAKPTASRVGLDQLKVELGL